MKRLSLVMAATLLLTATAASANLLFEGWFEVYLGSQKVGYMTERYEFTNNKFKYTYYLKTNAEGNNITESVKEYSKADLGPLSYAYTSKVGDQVKVIDAKFKGDVMNMEVFDGKNKTKTSKRIKKGTFLSNFLLYLILQQKGGLATGKNYTYNAIAEEDGEVYTGHAFVKDEETVKGKKAFKILNEYKGDHFFTWVSDHGAILLTRDPDKNIDVRFSENEEAATKGMGVNLQDIKLLFGNVPGDGETPKAEETAASEADAVEPDAKPPKHRAVAHKRHHLGVMPTRPGQGVPIKGVPPPKPDDQQEPPSGQGVSTSGGAAQSP